MAEASELRARLHESGHKLTPQRTAVWEVLVGAHSHLTADEVAAATSPQVNLASVYRALGLFTEIGLTRESHLGTDGSSRWEIAHPDDQFHLVCEQCGSVEHHGGDLVAQVRGHLEGEHGFAANSIELSVKGSCARCAG